ncbi:TPA: hypothetical protein EYP70_01810 [Candidatus Bathyarchaeota archaeon]|nr:hypothetical protein [Candidatus Bathyarchaeota archaeon]
MKGDAKRDYLPTFSYHQPYWPYFKLINDYFARASYVCSQGKYYADLLLLHSISSAWATYSPIKGKDPSSLPNKYNNLFVNLMENLLSLHWDFDLGDEIIMERHGKVEAGKMRIGKMLYKTVIVPPSLNWSRRTYLLLKDFLESGGTVIFMGEKPKLIDGRESGDEWNSLIYHPNVKSIKFDIRLLDEALKQILPKQISILDEEGNEVRDIYVNHRVDGSQHIFFLANTNRETTHRVRIILLQQGRVEEWNLFDGSIEEVAVLDEGEKTVIDTVFPPAGSRVFVINTKERAKMRSGEAEILSKKVVKLSELWKFKRLHPNVLVLDKGQYSLDGKEWSEVKPIWKIRHEVWGIAGLQIYKGIQPWVLRAKGIKPKKITVHLKIEFKSEIVGKRVYFVIEKPEIWNLSVNGEKVPTLTEEWQWDRQFGKIDISEFIKIGRNEILLSCIYDLDTPIEDMYLVGDFGVKKLSDTEYILTEEPKFLKNGDWTSQGYYFYSGTIVYEGNFVLKELFKRVLIHLPDAKGCLFLISVNDAKPLPICWNPLEVDVTDRVRKGRNKLRITVVSTLRNTFGPLHHVKGDLTFVGPGSFIDEDNWIDSYQLVPYGLIRGAEVIIFQ